MLLMLLCLSYQDLSWERNDLELYGFIKEIAAPNGLIFVYDSAENRILRISPQGELLGSFGRKGNGPGEFNSPGHLMADHQHLYVDDQNIARIHVFDHQGVFQESLETPRRLLKTYKVRGGWLYIDGENPLEAKLIFTDAAFGNGKKVVDWVLEGAKSTQPGGVSWAPINPAPNRASIAIAPDGSKAFFYKPGKRFEILIIDGDSGTITSTIKREYQLTPFDKGWGEQQYEKALKENAAQIKRVGRAPAAAFPDFFPPIKSLRIGLDGNLLVAPGLAYYQKGLKPLAYDMDGSFLGYFSSGLAFNSSYYQPGWVLTSRFNGELSVLALEPLSKYKVKIDKEE